MRRKIENLTLADTAKPSRWAGKRKLTKYPFAIFSFIAINFILLASTAEAECDPNRKNAKAISRFVTKEQEVFDKRTGLTWSRCSVGMSWSRGGKGKRGECTGSPKLLTLENAQRAAQKIGDGWRLPTIEELTSILERGCTNPAIDSLIFPDIRDSGEGAPYWSRTPIDAMPALYYYVDFMRGEIDGHTRGFPLAVRLVRNKK